MLAHAKPPSSHFRHRCRSAALIVSDTSPRSAFRSPRTFADCNRNCSRKTTPSVWGRRCWIPIISFKPCSTLKRAVFMFVGISCGEYTRTGLENGCPGRPVSVTLVGCQLSGKAPDMLAPWDGYPGRLEGADVSAGPFACSYRMTVVGDDAVAMLTTSGGAV